MTPDEWFDAYGQCHQHPTNKLIHWIAVPTIFLSIAGFLWDIPFPSLPDGFFLLNWATVVMAAVLIFYFRLSLTLGIGMTIFSFICIALIVFYESLNTGAVWLTSLILFCIMWVLQFIGHHIEGKKPAFFDDLKFLLIGPLWLMGFMYRAFGIKY